MKDFNLETSPKINTGFIIPDNYFDGFSENLMQRLPKNELKTKSIFIKKQTWIYSAAAILLISISLPIIKSFDSSSNIEDEHIESYLAYNSTVSDFEIVSLMDENDLKSITNDLKVEDQSIENELFDNENLEQYITQ